MVTLWCNFQTGTWPHDHFDITCSGLAPEIPECMQVKGRSVLASQIWECARIKSVCPRKFISAYSISQIGKQPVRI
jgi:hypothetical protein